jgi:hypothetical protein
MAETPKFGELDVFNFSCVATDGLVEVDDFVVGKGKGSKKLKYILGVLLEFIGPMGEGA